MFLVYGIESVDGKYLTHLTLQGIADGGRQAKGSVSAASEEFAKAIGTIFEMVMPIDGYHRQLIIYHDIFRLQSVQPISDLSIRRMEYRDTERSESNRMRGPAPF